MEKVNKLDTQFCYVCNDVVKLEVDKYCYKPYGDGGKPTEETKYRHFWHGVPGITRAVGGMNSFGFVGYAKTLKDARRRAEYYMSDGYTAPEVKQGEQLVLDEVNRLEELDKESN